MSPRTTLVLGGARAGKSAFAVARARALADRVAFVATAEAGDGEMAARIARHRAERPASWRTLEVPLELAATLRALQGTTDVVIVDCLTLWVANLLRVEPNLSDTCLAETLARLEAVLRGPSYALIVVSNEVGWGIHPETELGRRFRDALGAVNQAVARASDEVILMVAGCPLTVKIAGVTPGAVAGNWRA
jgi:adenosylcobinamide kinase / adenosylcobinamide-phosphate guanylyltransferase